MSAVTDWLNNFSKQANAVSTPIADIANSTRTISDALTGKTAPTAGISTVTTDLKGDQSASPWGDLGNLIQKNWIILLVIAVALVFVSAFAKKLVK